MKHPDQTGKRFGKLIILSFAGLNKWNNARWLCRCDCGETKIVSGCHLHSGNTTSCGCEKRNRMVIMGKGTKTHGETIGHRSKEHSVWHNMKDRCLNVNRKFYKDYGARGIRICDRWLNSFESFLADMGRAPGPEYTIDRVNNDGNYEPSNCRWATRAEQVKNRRIKNTAINNKEVGS